MTDLDQPVFSGTLRDAAIKVFNEDWNWRRKVLQMSPREEIRLHLTLEFSIGVDQARDILSQMKETA
jgi:hypothetical protein